MKIFVSYEQNLTEQLKSKKEYGDWYAKYQSRVSAVKLTSPQTNRGNYDEIELGFDVSLGDPIFVLSYQYSTGDSFGTSLGNIEIVWAFKHAEVAFFAKENLEKDLKAIKFEFFAEGMQPITIANAAHGYFESITEVNVDIFKVTQ
jgi:hypothetical protein